MVSVNDRLLDFQVAQQIKWIRYGNRESAEALKILNRVDSQLTEALRSVDLENMRFTEARAVALKAQVTELINATHARLAPAISESARDATVVAAEAETAAFKRILPAGLDVTTPNLGVLQTAASLKPFNGAVLGDWVNQLRENDLKRTWSTILDGITSGTTTDDLIRTLNGTRSLGYKDGVREVTRRGTEALVRTSINHATNTGRQMVWEANSDIIKGVRWVATLDTRTTPICQHRDGRVGPVTDAAGWEPPEGAARLDPPMARPPAHPNCRSTTVAVTKSWRELGFDMDELPPGTRASMDGQVPGNLTYYDWLRRQSEDVQKDVLGPTRLALWKEQGIKPERFVNDKGRLLTLDQLRKQAKVNSPGTSTSTRMSTKVAVNEYSSTLYNHINVKLRTGKAFIDPDVVWENSYIRNVARGVDEAMESASLSSNKVLYRYANKEWFTGSEFRKGATFMDEAFVSTSASKSNAAVFDFNDAWLFKIEAPKGSRVLDLKGMTVFNESEFLIDRRTVFRVKSINRARKQATLEIVSHQSKPDLPEVWTVTREIFS
jgi:SPP1 gp7 family putative phage head morphogenesis protein